MNYDEENVNPVLDDPDLIPGQEDPQFEAAQEAEGSWAKAMEILETLKVQCKDLEDQLKELHESPLFPRV